MTSPIQDRIWETSVTVGLGDFQLNGPIAATYRAFGSVFADGQQVYYLIEQQSLNVNQWEIGLGTYLAATNSISRTTVLQSSNGNALVNFVAGTKDIWCDVPAEVVWPPANVNINVSAPGSSNAQSGITFLNGNGVTFGYDGTNITASASGGGGGGGITAVNISAGTLSSNVSAFTFSNGSNVTFGFDGSNITASVATSLTAINVSGGASSANVSAITFSNANNVTFGYDKTNVTASVTVASTQGSITVSAGASSAAVSAITFSNANNVTFGYDKTNITASANPGVSAIADNAGHTIAAGLVEFAGGNVAFGFNGSTMSGSVASSLTNIRISGGASSANVSAITFSNANNVSFGYDKTNITATVTVASTQGSITVSAGASSSAVSALTFSNANHVSFGYDGTNVTASIATSLTAIRLSAGASSSVVSAVTFSNANNISFGYDATNVTASFGFNISGGASSANVSAVTFSNANNVTFGYDQTNITASVTVASSQGSINVSASQSSANVSAITFSNANNITFGYDKTNVTASFGFNISASQSSANVSAVTFSNANNVTFGYDKTNITATVTVASTQGSITISGGASSAAVSAVTFSNANNITFGYDKTNVTASYGFNISASQSSAAVSAVTFSNLNNITFGYDKTNVTASYALNVSAPGGTSNALSGITFSNSNGVSFGLSTGAGVGTITASVVQPATISFFENPIGGLNAGNSTTITLASGGSVYVFPFLLPLEMSASFIRFFCSNTMTGGKLTSGAANGSTSAGYSATLQYVFYSQGTGANSLSLRYVTSSSVTEGIKQIFSGSSSSYTNSMTISYLNGSGGTSSTLITTQGSSATYTAQPTATGSFTGPQFLDIPFAASLSPGNYWLGLNYSSASGGFASFPNMSHTVFGQSQLNSSFAPPNVATNSSYQFQPGLGVWSTNTTGTTTSSIGLASISSQASNPIAYFQMIRQN